MTSAANSFPERLTKIDELTRRDHHHLRDGDNCYFLGEYTARQGLSYSPTNNLIINFKKPMDRRGTPQWKYKGAMISKAAKALFNAMGRYDLRPYTFIPVPPSKLPSDPHYDDRMLRMLTKFSELMRINRGYPLNIQESVTQIAGTDAAHDIDRRPQPHEIAKNYQTSDGKLREANGRIIIIDDVLTTGCHFRAMESVIRNVRPEVEVRGVFLARRAPLSADFDEI